MSSLGGTITSVIFTPNITVNSISLSSTGVLQNFNFVQLVGVHQLVRWSKRCKIPLMMLTLLKSGGEH